MSDISISADTVQTMSMENLFTGADSIRDTGSESASGINPWGSDSREQTVAGMEVASRTQDYLGAGTDFSSTGTDIDIQQTIQAAAAQTGIGTIADKIA